MRNLKFRLISLSIIISIFLNYSPAYSNSYLDKVLGGSKKIIKHYKKPLFFLGVISLLGILAFSYKKFFIDKSNSSGNQPASDDAVVADESQPANDNDVVADESQPEGGDIVVKARPLPFGSQDFDINDDADWGRLKIVWHIKDEVSEEERKAILDELSDEKKVELELEERKWVISNIRKKIYSPSKDISDDEWEVAMEVSESMPEFKPDIAELLRKPKNEVIIAAKNLDKMRKKLYSREKIIRRNAWAFYREMHKKIPTYKPLLGEMLFHEEGLDYVLKWAREIDKEHDQICKDAGSFTVREVRKLQQKCFRLSQYKSYLSKIKF